MSLADKIMADRKTQIMAQTWGHLFPDDGTAIKGNIIMAYTVDGSPWWYTALTDFLDKHNRHRLPYKHRSPGHRA